MLIVSLSLTASRAEDARKDRSPPSVWMNLAGSCRDACGTLGSASLPPLFCRFCKSLEKLSHTWYTTVHIDLEEQISVVSLSLVVDGNFV